MTITNGARTMILAAMAAVAIPAAGSAQTVTAEENSRSVHAFLSAVDVGEVRMSMLAAERGTSADVKAFAGRMVTEHTQAIHAREALVSADGEGLFSAQMGGPAGDEHAGHGAFTAEQLTAMQGVLMQHPLGQRMAQYGAGNLQVLQGVNAGPQFDVTYMDAQIAAHRYALGQVDRLITQGGVTDEMMAAMRTTRAAIATHLEQAQAIRTGLGS
jgi:putative membrane protein